jgi:hypothetical protein
VWTRPLAQDDPQLQALIAGYVKRWKVQQFIPPTSWVGKGDEDELLYAALGFTVSPDHSVVYLSDLLCLRSGKGVQAMKDLMEEFQEYAVSDKRIQMVFAQCIYENMAMRKLFESTILKPTTVVYALSRAQYEGEDVVNNRST